MKALSVEKVQIVQGKTLHDEGYLVGGRLWRPSWKYSLPKKIIADGEAQKFE